MKVRVKKMDGSTFDLEIDATHSVMDLKALVRQHEGVEESRQRLIYHGRVLKDDDQLTTYAKEDGSFVVHLVVRPESAPSQPSQTGAAAPDVGPQMNGLHPLQGAVVTPFQQLGNGVMVGSVALNAAEGQQPDVGALISQLISSTVGSLNPSQATPEAPAEHGRIPSAANNLSARRRLTAQSSRVSAVTHDFHPPLERSVASAEVVISQTHSFRSLMTAAAESESNSAAVERLPHDIDSENWRTAVAEGIATLSHAFDAAQTPCRALVGNLRSQGLAFVNVYLMLL